MEDELKTYYVTFGMGTLMKGYYQPIKARDRWIVAAYMNKHYGKLWANLYEVTDKPNGYKLSEPLELHYRRASDV